MGRDTRAVLESTLGLGPDQIAALGEQGVIGFLPERVPA